MRKVKNNYDGVDKEIEALLQEMSTVERHSEKYAAMTKNLKTLYEVRDTGIKGVDSNTLFMGGVIIAQTFLIVFAEEWRPITSKALSVITRVRV